MKNENNRKPTTSGLETFVHLMESQMEAIRSGRVVVFGHGRLITPRRPEKVHISGEDIRNLSDTGMNIEDNNENED